jgi:hypothetical protein
MSKPVYRMFLVNPTEAWYQLSEAEQDDLLTKVNQALEAVGGKSVIACNSSWATEQLTFWGVEEFPNIEAVQRLSQLHDELEWARYSNSTTFLGTPMPQAE